MSNGLLFQDALPTGIIPRDYQSADVEESFRLWDSGTVGALTRCFTGGGKTIMSCLKIRRWLDRGANYKAIIISYEDELIDQFADEVWDVLTIKPGIEKGAKFIELGQIPDVVVATRQTLLTRELATQEQRNFSRSTASPISACSPRAKRLGLSKRSKKVLLTRSTSAM